MTRGIEMIRGLMHERKLSMRAVLLCRRFINNLNDSTRPVRTKYSVPIGYPRRSPEL